MERPNEKIRLKLQYIMLYLIDFSVVYVFFISFLFLQFFFNSLVYLVLQQKTNWMKRMNENFWGWNSTSSYGLIISMISDCFHEALVGLIPSSDTHGVSSFSHAHDELHREGIRLSLSHRSSLSSASQPSPVWNVFVRRYHQAGGGANRNFNLTLGGGSAHRCHFETQNSSKQEMKTWFHHSDLWKHGCWLRVFTVKEHQDLFNAV